MADESHFRLRIPANLKAKIEVAAKAANRSMNAEVIALLEFAFAQDELADDFEQQQAETADRLDQMQRVMNDLLAKAGMPLMDATPAKRLKLPRDRLP